ncbi:MAG: hypothetical protein J7K21_03760 [Desulfurococcales archaeon]|nr:hypothetical protein [Desulfurococcales archaeon]
MVEAELLSEIREIKERLARIESMLRFIIERNIEEAEPLPDEVEAIKEYEADKEKDKIKLVSLDNILGKKDD